MMLTPRWGEKGAGPLYLTATAERYLNTTEHCTRFLFPAATEQNRKINEC